MNAMVVVAVLFGVLLIGLVVWVLVQNTQDQQKNQALESQMNELRRDLMNLSSAQVQSTTKMETIADTVAVRLEAVTTAVQKGVRDSAEVTSQITSQAQSAMSNELRNTREQINQIRKHLRRSEEPRNLWRDDTRAALGRQFAAFAVHPAI